MTRHFEDFATGDVFELGSRAVTKEEIVAFAREYDPQFLHVDEQAATAGPFGGLIASGWHTGALWMRMYVDALLVDSVSMGSPGIEELRWLQPVRPGDTLRGRLTVLETAPSERRPDRGTVRSRGEMLNQHGELVLTMVARGYFGRRQ